MNRYEAVFLDVGGTLAWAEPSADEIWANALRDYGHQVSAEEVVERTGVRGPEVNRADIHRALGDVEVELRLPFPRNTEEQAVYFRLFDAAVLEMLGVPPTEEILETIARRFEDDLVLHLYEDVIPTLHALRDAGYRLSVISNATHELPRRLEGLGIHRYFDSITYSWEVGVEKPNPRIFLTALERSDVKASQAVHVGDSYDADVLGARGVGITPILIDREGSGHERDCTVVQSLHQVPGCL